MVGAQAAARNATESAWPREQRPAFQRRLLRPRYGGAVANAAQRYGLTVNLPSAATLEGNKINIDTAESIPPDRLLRIAELSDGELPLVGDLRWSDAALGWVASWSLAVNGQRHRWSVSGVNYDEAFRNAVRGAARILSGNGEPM